MTTWKRSLGVSLGGLVVAGGIIFAEHQHIPKPDKGRIASMKACRAHLAKVLHKPYSMNWGIGNHWIIQHDDNLTFVRPSLSMGGHQAGLVCVMDERNDVVRITHL